MKNKACHPFVQNVKKKILKLCFDHLSFCVISTLSGQCVLSQSTFSFSFKGIFWGEDGVNNAHCLCLLQRWLYSFSVTTDDVLKTRWAEMYWWSYSLGFKEISPRSMSLLLDGAVALVSTKQTNKQIQINPL